MSARPLHVLMTADAVGGVWTYALTLLRILGEHQVTCTLAVTGPRPDAAALGELAALPHVTYRYRPDRLEWMPDADLDVERTGEWLVGLAAARPPDVVHVNGYAHAAWPFGCRVLVVAHSCVRSWWRAVRKCEPPADWDAYARRVRLGLSHAGVAAAPTAAMLHALGREYGFSGPALVVPNGLPPVARARTRKQPLVLAAGRVWDEAKNIGALDRVADRVRWPIAVAGDTHVDGGGSAAPSHLRVLGRLPRAEVTRWMARASIYALPARYEPFGLSVLEAAQQECALVLGDIPSLRELWDGAAWFVPPDDQAALQRALRQLMEEQGTRGLLGRSARARAARYSDRRCALRYLDVYRALAGTHGEVLSCAS